MMVWGHKEWLSVPFKREVESCSVAQASLQLSIFSQLPEYQDYRYALLCPVRYSLSTRQSPSSLGGKWDLVGRCEAVRSLYAGGSARSNFKIIMVNREVV